MKIFWIFLFFTNFHNLFKNLGVDAILFQKAYSIFCHKNRISPSLLMLKLKINFSKAEELCAECRMEFYHQTRKMRNSVYESLDEK